MAKKKEEMPRKEEEIKEEAEPKKIISEELEEAREIIAKRKEKIEKNAKTEKEMMEKAVKGEELLVPLENYIKAGVHLGTKVITAQMKPFMYKRRADGLAIIDTKKIDAKIREAAAMLAQYSPKDVVVSCKREAGWLALNKFAELTGVRVFTKKYPAGIITNIKLQEFFEPSIMMIIDPWIDKNPMHDAVNLNIPIISLCDSNNVPIFIDLIVPCNNKSNKSIGLIFWILAKEILKIRGEKAKMPPYEEFIGESL